MGAWLAMALLLVPGTSRARYSNVNTGRFQTMDAYQGNNEDPLSLSQYLYGADNPVNNSDPSGNDIELDFGFNIRLGSILGPLSGYAPLLSESGLGAFTPVGTGGNRIAGIVFDETSLIVPQLMAGKSPGGPENSDSKSRASLNAAREKIAEVANCQRQLAPPVIPNPTTPVQTAQCKIAWMPPIWLKENLQRTVFSFGHRMTGRRRPSIRNMLARAGCIYKPYVVFGAFRKVGSGGDVPEGNNIYIFFYTGIPF